MKIGEIDKRAHLCDPVYTVYDITDKTHYLELLYVVSLDTWETGLDTLVIQ